MVQGQLNVATNIVMAGMIAIGIVGICIDVALRMFEQRLKARWGR
jgi:NitT/TauT family transport system permease protein